MKKKILLALFAAALFFPGMASAIDFTASGTILTVTFKEPTTNFDTTPLDDLAYTNVYYRLDAGAEVKGPNIPATTSAGGGNISTTVTVPIGANQRATVTIRATATDTSGNESAKSAAVVKTVDRLPPMPPQ